MPASSLGEYPPYSVDLTDRKSTFDALLRYALGEDYEVKKAYWQDALGNPKDETPDVCDSWLDLVEKGVPNECSHS